MTLLLSFQDLSKSFGSRELFKNISMGIFEGDKVGFIGPNGSGKSTLLKIIAKKEKSDTGSVSFKRSLRVGYVAQETHFEEKSIEEIVQDALSDTTLSEDEKKIAAIIILSKFGFEDFEVTPSKLSGGWKKRLSIAKAMVSEPDLLLLDEPTNHLDLEGITWLESFLKNASFAYWVISHDRYFLQNIATKVIELNKGYPEGLFAITGPYSEFLEKKEAFFKGQANYERSLASKVRREIEWLRASPKARTTKAEARIKEAHKVISELDDVKGRNKQVRTDLGFSSTKRETKKLLVASNLSKSLNSKTLFSNLNFTLSPGSCLGIIGTNGSGKTTLLKILNQEIQPDSGTLKFAEGVKIVYFDQHKNQLPPNITLRVALAGNSDTVLYKGEHIHINAWCKRFLFSPSLLDGPINTLSGGEKARVLIARLMLQPADILLLDEPTNDLDLETLEILEDNLQEFPGAIVLITHDRYMLDVVATELLAIEMRTDNPFFASLSQIEAHQKESQKSKEEIKKAPTPPKVIKENPLKKLSYNEKREYEQIDGKIAQVEKDLKALQEMIETPQIATNPIKLAEFCAQIDKAQEELENLYTRWQELEDKSK